MNTKNIKRAIYAEMINGASLLEAKLIVLNYFNDRLEVATNELKTEITMGATQ